MGCLAGLAWPLIMVWLGADERYRGAGVILMMVCLPYQMNELTGPCSAFHRGTGKPLRELVYPVVQLALVLVTVTIGFVLMWKSIVVICGAGAISMFASAVVYVAYT